MIGRYIFLVKGKAVTQVCDDEPNSEIIIRQLMQQGFYISHLHIYANNDEQAFMKYQEHYAARYSKKSFDI